MEIGLENHDELQQKYEIELNLNKEIEERTMECQAENEALNTQKDKLLKELSILQQAIEDLNEKLADQILINTKQV